jgi:hypothetical protein
MTDPTEPNSESRREIYMRLNSIEKDVHAHQIMIQQIETGQKMFIAEQAKTNAQLQTHHADLIQMMGAIREGSAADKARQDGAIGVFKWMVATGIALGMLVLAVLGIVLRLVL